MQKEFLNVVHGGLSYVGYAFDNLPLPAALLAAQQQIDQVADQARTAVIGDPLRVVEYQLAEHEAKAFAATGFEGDTPPAVQAWVEAAGLEPRAAAESILAEAQAWQGALYAIRAARLKGKQAVLKATSHEQAEGFADTAIATIRASVVGVGNA
ncbi:hypothetical protein [Pseudomonas sp. GZD-222]|uniref:hypothetical protein n=1 Tax=Pseudomonas sp. GZD-222 TaxID=3404805 RepID=UPI003BB712C6